MLLAFTHPGRAFRVELLLFVSDLLSMSLSPHPPIHFVVIIGWPSLLSSLLLRLPEIFLVPTLFREALALRLMPDFC